MRPPARSSVLNNHACMQHAARVRVCTSHDAACARFLEARCFCRSLLLEARTRATRRARRRSRARQLQTRMRSSRIGTLNELNARAPVIAAASRQPLSSLGSRNVGRNNRAPAVTRLVLKLCLRQCASLSAPRPVSTPLRPRSHLEVPHNAGERSCALPRTKLKDAAAAGLHTPFSSPRQAPAPACDRASRPAPAAQTYNVLIK